MDDRGRKEKKVREESEREKERQRTRARGEGEGEAPEAPQRRPDSVHNLAKKYEDIWPLRVTANLFSC